jgi:hypothetical protein
MVAYRGPPPNEGLQPIQRAGAEPVPSVVGGEAGHSATV